MQMPEAESTMVLLCVGASYANVAVENNLDA